jgi:hypothetical protein
MALELVFTALVDDHLAARMDLARARITRRSEFCSPSPCAPRILTPPHYSPTQLAIQRSSPSDEASRLAAPVPTRAPLSTRMVPPQTGVASTSTLLETIPEEEEVESRGPQLGLTLSEAYSVSDTP